MLAMCIDGATHFGLSEASCDNGMLQHDSYMNARRRLLQQSLTQVAA